METKILKIEKTSLALAKSLIEQGKCVAFPTETVYGLGANAYDDGAVRRIFEIKGRPADNPLIVHVHKDYDLSTLVDEIPDYTRLLAQAFLPGPLTMVYKSTHKVSPAVSCGLNTLAIRIPSHEGAQSFLRYLNAPIAAPSANLSKHISPVTAQHVYKDLQGRIECILDGGRCEGGIESTVLDCTRNIPRVLRSGLITQDMIAQVVGECESYVLVDGEHVPSPGMKYKHYSPDCQTKLYYYEQRARAAEEYFVRLEAGERVYVMCDEQTSREFEKSGCRHILNLGKTENEIAANLYDKLHEGEERADIIIAVAPQKQDGVMVGVMNRLKKACGAE